MPLFVVLEPASLFELLCCKKPSLRLRRPLGRPFVGRAQILLG